MPRQLAAAGLAGQKVGRAAAGIARHPIMYPALRARVHAHRAPHEALVEVGFSGAAIDEFAADYERVAPELYSALEREMRNTAAPPELFAKLGDPDAPANASNLLAYLAVRLLAPHVVVETGTFAGLLSTFMLCALTDNGHGRLVSLDLAAYRPIGRAIDFPLPGGREPGFAIPEHLRDRFELVLGDARRTLPGVLERAGPLGVFVHDSLQTRRHMLFEYRSAWSALAPGGLLLTNNAFVTSAFWQFTRSRRLPLRFVGGDFGVARKSPA